MKRNIIFGALTILFFIIYWKILALIYNQWVPMNVYTDLLSVFIVIFVNFPLSAISARQTIKVMKEIWVLNIDYYIVKGPILT